MLAEYGADAVSKETVTIRMEREDRDGVDRLAALLDRDRSWVINDAVRAYREFHERQAARIREGIAAADAGDFLTDEETQAMWRELGA